MLKKTNKLTQRQQQRETQQIWSHRHIDEEG